MSEDPSRHQAGIPAFYLLSGWVVCVLDEIKAILSTDGAWLLAELGDKKILSYFAHFLYTELKL